MNGDGFQDLITYPFRILINDRNGHFPYIPAWHPFVLGGDHFKIQTADIDQNGTLDLFISGSQRANGLFAGTTMAFMNVSYDPTNPSQGYFSFERKILFSPSEVPLQGNISSMKPNGVSIGDLNNDGMPDVIFINSAKGAVATSTSSVTLNNGSGTMLYSQAISDAEDIALGDLDNDGDLDLYLARSGNQPDEVWLNDGNGIFTNSGQQLGTDDSINSAMADLDGDGDLDIVTTNNNITQNSPHRVWINDGTGFLTLSSFSFGAGHKTESLKLLDIDNDGDTDIVTLGGREGHPQKGSLYLSSNEVWLNQLISSDHSYDLNAAIELCKNNPNDYGLYNQSQMDQALTYAFSEGELACQTAPQSYGLYDQTYLDSELLVAISQGEQNCQDNPSSCNLFDQNSIDQAIIYGLTDGREEGLIAGKQSCIDNPNTCGLFNQDALIEAETKGQLAGEESGKITGIQACINDPSSCGLFDQNTVNETETDALASGFNQGKQSCIDDPDSCGLYGQQQFNGSINDIISQIIKELPKGQLNSICRKNPYSPLCKRYGLNFKKVVKKITKNLSKWHLKSICKYKPNSPLCQ